jgi:hypothetical protein
MKSMLLIGISIILPEPNPHHLRQQIQIRPMTREYLGLLYQLLGTPCK